MYSENINFLSYNNANNGIYNKVQFLEDLDIELSRSKISKTPLSIAMLTFKDYNAITKNLGTEAANHMTENAIRLITSSLKFPDKVYRYNYRTLIVLLVNIDKTTAQRVIKRILEFLRDINLDINKSQIATELVSTIDDNTGKHSSNSEKLFIDILEKHKKKLSTNGI